MKYHICRDIPEKLVHLLRRARKGYASAFQAMVFHLENADLYSCSALAALAEDRRMITPEQRPILMILLEDIAHQNAFHQENDGLAVVIPPQEWFGLRWKVALWKTVMQDAIAPTIGRVDLLVSWREEA